MEQKYGRLKRTRLRVRTRAQHRSIAMATNLLRNPFVRCLVALPLLAQSATAQPSHEKAPINYSSSQPTDRVSQLVSAIEAGTKELEWDEDHGWLVSLLEHLDVPRSSQTLVFSKTSMQFRRISPRYPRAIYFSDDVYVGWVHRGEVIELGVVDPKLGAVFYSVPQKKSQHPQFKRDRGECLACHDNRRTQSVPGFLVRSVFPQADGQPAFRLGTVTTDPTTPFDDRFGGWYVTGSHGKMRHRGNVVVLDADSRDTLNRETGANLTELPRNVQRENYLEPTSDLVAMLVLEHQSQMHNLVTKAGYTCRQAIFQQKQMNAILERPEDYRSESTTRRIEAVAEKLVRYLFFCDEFQFTSPVSGTSEFANEFTAQAICDSKGRSLRDLDLKTRLLRYPCSHLIYSDSFLALPDLAIERIKKRMLEVLRDEDQAEDFNHITQQDRLDILSILRETHPLFMDE